MKLVTSLVKLFRANRDENASSGMMKYMKNNFVFLGISRPSRSVIQKDWLKDVKIACAEGLDEELIRQLWCLEEREFQYAALDVIIALKKVYKKDDINLAHYLLTEKAWWDSVDTISSHFLGELVTKFPELKDTHIRPWSMSESIWLRRSSIICQLKSKKDTDTQLLEEVISRNCDTQEFFINKAIGWALREYSKTNPLWVVDFLKTHKLHPLSVKEGSKYI